MDFLTFLLRVIDVVDIRLKNFIFKAGVATGKIATCNIKYK